MFAPFIQQLRLGITCLHRPSTPFKKVLYISTQPNYELYVKRWVPVGHCHYLKKQWKPGKPLNLRTLHFIVKTDDHTTKTANYSSKEPELSEHCWKKGWKPSLLSTRQEDRDNIAANTSLTDLECRVTRLCSSLQRGWYERKGIQQKLHEWSKIWKECLLNLLTIFVICQEKSWLYYINPHKLFFSDSLKLAKGMKWFV